MHPCNAFFSAISAQGTIQGFDPGINLFLIRPAYGLRSPVNLMREPKSRKKGW